MNKRIKRKVIKKAIIKYNNKEVLSKKEYKLIKPYIVLSQFDFKSFFRSTGKIIDNLIGFIVKVINKATDFLTHITNAVKGDKSSVCSDIQTYYGGYNLND
ncbi:MAG: hypothetical protein WBA84_06775 [Carnobacterium sp.]|uniref:hypothetical protein n=1 Tax=Carnobacterium sp. TaxID=48221 RepID=UPI003C7711B2